MSLRLIHDDLTLFTIFSDIEDPEVQTNAIPGCVFDGSHSAYVETNKKRKRKKYKKNDWEEQKRSYDRS